MNEGLDKQLAVERAVSVFANLDVDGDGDITEVNQLYKSLNIGATGSNPSID